jgi:hypothetical protein
MSVSEVIFINQIQKLRNFKVFDINKCLTLNLKK